MSSDQGLTFNGHKQLSEYRAQVVDVEDPKGLLRVQVRVPGWWDAVPDKDLPWAEYRFNDARPNGGNFTPAEVDDWVWVDFPNSDTRFPRITGWCHFAPGGKPNAPHETWVGPDAYEHKRLAVQPEPDSPEYHGTDATTKHGVTIEIEPSGAYRVTQRGSGTAVEISKEGHVVVHGEEKGYWSSEDDTEVDVGQNLMVRVKGDAKVGVDGNAETNVKGDAKLKVNGNADAQVQGFMQLRSKGPGLVKSDAGLTLKGPSRTLTL